MALETQLSTLLKGLCPRTFPDFAPVATPRPYVTWQQIGGDVITPIGREVPNVENAEVQINVWSDTRLEAKALLRQIEAAMILETGFTCKPTSAPVSDFDADLPVYGARQDFKVWCSRT